MEKLDFNSSERSFASAQAVLEQMKQETEPGLQEKPGFAVVKEWLESAGLAGSALIEAGCDNK